MQVVTAVKEQTGKPLQTGSRLTIIGLLVVLLALALDPTSTITWLVNLAGVGATTWGAVRVLNWLVHLRGRRSLSEASVGVFLMGSAAAMTITTAQGPQDRGNSWLIGISAVGFALLGLSLIATAVVDHRGEHRRIINPPPPPPPGSITEPQPPGTLLLPQESSTLRLTVAISSICFMAIVAISLLR